MCKLTQRDLCVLYLFENGGWVRAVELRGKPYKDKFLGSESDRRMIEVMVDVKKCGFYEVGEVKYAIEESSEGKFKTYRARNLTPIVKYQTVIKDGREVVQKVVVSPQNAPQQELRVVGVMEELDPWTGAGRGVYHDIYESAV